jgi:hypothetical protein
MDIIIHTVKLISQLLFYSQKLAGPSLMREWRELAGSSLMRIRGQRGDWPAYLNGDSSLNARKQETLLSKTGILMESIGFIPPKSP